MVGAPLNGSGNGPARGGERQRYELRGAPAEACLGEAVDMIKRSSRKERPRFDAVS